VRNLTIAALLGGLLFVAPKVVATVESQASVLSLLIEPGAREIGMGKTGTASSRGALAAFYNPALLSGQQRTQVEATVFKWLPALADDIFYAHFTLAAPWAGWGNLAVAMTFLDLGSQTRTTEYGDIIGTFDSNQMILGLSYAAGIGGPWHGGLTFKVIIDNLAPNVGASRELGEGVGRTVGLDLGAAYHAANWTAGVALRNWGPKISYIDADQASPIPVNLNIGGEWRAVDSDDNDVTVVLDIYKPLVHPDGNWITAPFKAIGDVKARERWDSNDDGFIDNQDKFRFKMERWDSNGDGTVDDNDSERLTGEIAWDEERKEIDLHFGAEWVYADLFAFRGGYFNDWDGKRSSWTVGMGVILAVNAYNLHVDMSLTPNFELNSRNPRATMSLDF